MNSWGDWWDVNGWEGGMTGVGWFVNVKLPMVRKGDEGWRIQSADPPPCSQGPMPVCLCGVSRSTHIVWTCYMAQTFFTFHLLLCSIRLWDLLYMHSTVRWGDLADQAACYSPLRPHHLKYNSGHGYQCQTLVHFCCLRLSHCHLPRREQFVACPASDITPIISQSELYPSADWQILWVLKCDGTTAPLHRLLFSYTSFAFRTP